MKRTETNDCCRKCNHVYDKDHGRIVGRRICKKCYRIQQTKYQHTPAQMKRNRERQRAYNHLQVVAFKAFWKLKKANLSHKLYDRHMAFVETVCATCDHAYENLSQKKLILLKQWQKEYL